LPVVADSVVVFVAALQPIVKLPEIVAMGFVWITTFVVAIAVAVQPLFVAVIVTV
jgi:hypothetical protein